MAATWNGTEWVDNTNPNVRFINGAWQNPSEGTYMQANGQWVNGIPTGPINYVNLSQPGSTFQGTNGATATVNSATSNPGASNPQSGYGYDLLDRSNAQETNVHNLDNASQAQISAAGDAAAAQRQQDLLASQQKIADLQSQTNLEISKGQNASQEKIAQLQHEISVENNRIALMNAQTQQEAEQRMERELQAKLESNPQDIVQAEFYKRALANPTTYTPPTAGGGAGAGGGGAVGSQGLNNGSSPGGVATASSANSQYASAPPAYSDEALSMLANNLFTQKAASWNPNMSGQGVFGSTIAAPNSIGRAQALALSPTEKGIMDSFISAGININGKRVALNPDDYWMQTQNSWVKPFSQAGQQNQYSL